MSPGSCVTQDLRAAARLTLESDCVRKELPLILTASLGTSHDPVERPEM
jgi:hypothetical protein